MATSVANSEIHRNGHLATAISTMAVGVLRRHTGRGPTRSRTEINDRLISVFLQDTLTHAEHTLMANGAEELVMHTRRLFQEIMRAELVAGVEALTGRTVAAFFGDDSSAPDMAIESFLLAPPSHRELGGRPGSADAWRALGTRRP